jgi:hypothetical protein
MKMINTLLRLMILLGCALAVSHGIAQTAPSWTSIGPAGGSLTTLLADPVSPRTTIYAGSDANGVFVSSDAGATWRSANNGIKTGQRQVYALAALGNNVYAATNTGVYMSAGGGTPAWVPLATSPLAPASTSVFDLMVSTGSTLYLAVKNETSVYSTSGTSANPTWVTAAALPAQSTVAGLGVIKDQIAVGSAGAVYVYVPDGSGSLVWVNSETIDLTLTTSALAGNTVTAMVSSPGKWAFACTLAGTVFREDLSNSWSGAWVPLDAIVSDSCNGLSIARVGSNGEMVLVVSTRTGAFVSDTFDETSLVPASLVPGPTFPAMTSAVNGALQLDPLALSNILWATEFGLYSSAISGVDSLLSSKGPAVAQNGPSKITTPSQRLDNVNVHDVAVLGSTLYAVAASNFNTYVDVMSSADGGASWSRTGLTTLFPYIRAIRSIVADKVHNVVYAGTDRGVFYFGTTWKPIGDDYDVSALAVGAKALYSGRKISAYAVPNSALVIQPLVDGVSFTPVQVSPGKQFNVSALRVSGGSVYVGGGTSTREPADTDHGPYENKVFAGPDFDPLNPSSPANWPMATKELFANESILSTVEIAGSEVFVGGYGFLKRSRIDAGWGDVIGLPVLNSGDTIGISALASDGQSLYVGTSGQGLFALSLATNTSSLVPANGSGDTGLSSQVVNGLKSIDGNLYVASVAGISMTTTVVNARSGGASGGTGGGCSMTKAGEPDPLLWLLLVIAALQIALTRRGRNHMVRLSQSKLTAEGESSL